MYQKMRPIGEVCADCGKEIGMLEPSYYQADPCGGEFGKTFHSHCGDPFGIKVKIAAEVAAEREACAQIALAIDSGRGNEKEIARAIRARAQ